MADPEKDQKGGIVRYVLSIDHIPSPLLLHLRNINVLLSIYNSGQFLCKSIFATVPFN